MQHKPEPTDGVGRSDYVNTIKPTRRQSGPNIKKRVKRLANNTLAVILPPETEKII